MNITIKKTIEPTFTVDQMMDNLYARIVRADDYGRNCFVNTVNDAANALWQDGAKIKAIKLIRTIFPMGLREAKEYCESKFNTRSF